MNSQLPMAMRDDGDDEPHVAIQYAVRLPSGETITYGDQSYVAYGEVLKDHPDGVIVRRTIRLFYGPWYPKQRNETPERRLREVAG